MKSKLFALLCGLVVTGLANAECPSSLNKEELIQCQKNEQNQEEKSVTETDSTISPITGEDVKAIEPSAGKEQAKATK